MKKIHLHKEDTLQGQFKTQDLNLLLTFQVNCPGCFYYALPLFNQLFKRYQDQIGFLGLSTAFEDFEQNTKKNTLLLLEKGTLVGETKKALKDQGDDQLPYSILFPVAMDKKMTPSDKGTAVENICLLDPDFYSWPNNNKDVLRKKVSNYLDHQKEVSLTFTTNQFKGTPTIVLFNNKKEILASWFGHVEEITIVEKIQFFIN